MNYNEVRKIDNECAKTLCARNYKGFGTGFDVQNGIIEIEWIKPECINLCDENGKETSFQDRIYRTDKISVAITVGFRPFYLEEKNGGNKSYRRTAGTREKRRSIPDRLQRVNPNTNRVYDKSGLCPTLNIMQGGNRQPMLVDGKKERYRIRKLTPKECWRLMGFSDEDFEKAAKENSNTQLYKQAGNSIVKDVLMAIFRNLVF